MRLTGGPAATVACHVGQRPTARFDSREGHDRRGAAVSDDGDVDGDGDARRSGTNHYAHSTRLSTASTKRAAPLDLGHRGDLGDDGRRKADGS